MSVDLDIYRAANVLIRKHGDEAPVFATMRHDDELLAAGDMVGCAVWKRVIRAIDELLAIERPKGASMQ